RGRAGRGGVQQGCEVGPRGDGGVGVGDHPASHTGEVVRIDPGEAEEETGELTSFKPLSQVMSPRISLMRGGYSSFTHRTTVSDGPLPITCALSGPRSNLSIYHA